MGEDGIYTDPITFTENWWGQAMDGALVRHILNAPEEHINHWAADCHDVAWTPTPWWPNDGFRPIVDLHGRWAQREERWRIGDELVRALALHARQIAIWDPLPEVLKSYYFPKTIPDYGREQLGHCLHALSRLAELARLGAVTWIPFSEDVDQANWYMNDALVSAVDKQLRDGSRREPWSDPLFPILYELLTNIRVVEAAEGTLHLVLHSVEEKQVFTELLAMGLHSIAHGRQSAMVNDLTVLAPKPLLPDMADLVALRKNSETFEEWRLALERALVAVGPLEGSNLTIGHARRLIDAELRPTRERIEREIRSSTALSVIRRLPHSLTWTSVGGVAAVIVGADPTIAAASTVSAALAQSIKEYLLGRREVDQRKAILRHCLSFAVTPDSQ